MFLADELIAIMSAEQWTLTDFSRQLRIAPHQLRALLVDNKLPNHLRLRIERFLASYRSRHCAEVEREDQQLSVALQKLPYDCSAKDQVVSNMQTIQALIKKYGNA